MSRATGRILLALAAIAVLVPSCVVVQAPSGGTPPSSRPAVVLPVTFENHLVAARRCERVGMTGTAFVKANLVLAFVQSTAVFSQSTNGVGTTSASSGFTGFAYKCPKAVLAALVSTDDAALDEDEVSDAER